MKRRAAVPAGIAVVALAAAGWLAQPAAADQDAPPTWIGIGGGNPLVCDGVLDVFVNLQRQDGRDIVDEQDTGDVTLEGQFGKNWVRLEPDYHTEGFRGWRIDGRGVPDAVRVTRDDTGVRSAPRLPQKGCPD